MYHSFTLAANAQLPIATRGRFVRYDSGSAGGVDESIVIKAGTAEVLLKPGKAVNLPGSVDLFYIRNYANAATITGVLQIEDAEIWDNRVSGEVSVIDGGMARTAANGAFMDYAAIGAMAARMSWVQLWNESTTHNLIVERIIFQAVAVADVTVGLASTQAASIVRYASSKLSGGAASTRGRLRRDQTVGSPVSQPLLNLPIAANGYFNLEFREPVVVAPGYGIVVLNNNINADINATFEFFEALR